MLIPDEILNAKSTLDLDAFKRDSYRGVAAIRSQMKDTQAKMRSKKTTCTSPNCNREESSSVPLRACSQCHAARYCSAECQKADWKAHKKSCLSFERLPICRDFDPTLIHPGCQYSRSPIFAAGHKDGIGFWVAPGGRINCRLWKTPGAHDKAKESEPAEGREGFMTPEFISQMSEVMSGPGWFLDVRVLVQNRRKEPIGVAANNIMVTISPEYTQEFFDGAWDEDEGEKDVERWEPDVKTVSGAKAHGQYPCHCKLTYFNGKRVEKGKKHEAIKNEDSYAVRLNPTEHACFNVQYRLGSMERTLDFQAWELLDSITVPALRADQIDLSYITGKVDQEEVSRWYADYKHGGELAFVASHHGEDRAKMQRALLAAQENDPILQHMEKGLKERLASNKPLADHIAELKGDLDSSNLPPDVVQRIKESIGSRRRKV